ncbi:hypothetical protein [Desulfitobacterium metallireducens]|uniref:Uncharacterized protein n=1 Tax=Desulfitobacterium metallireducens DSM 15288 TaxID=871968 RepID=W0EGC9_9FIRM|nr:hypothetical protein [Desulfitobacterium metallireducens]AHF08573.1 hypothetical protein DESME_08955 [Desulfitobacterium metallireducens DSM 15288]
MEKILPFRDLIQDNLGNYYFVSEIGENKMILVNAVVLYASNRIFSEELVKDHKGESLTHFATQMVKDHLKLLLSGEIPGKMYLLESLVGTYDIVVDALYDRDPGIDF